MRVAAECLPCILKQVVTTAEAAGADEETRRRVTIEGIKVLGSINLDRSPGEVSFDCLKRACEILENDDPYRAHKDKQNRLALMYIDALEKTVKDADDPLLVALKIAAAGNIIDSGARRQGYDVAATQERILSQPFGVDDYSLFQRRLAAAGRILYIVDNAGEVIFDRLVIERLGRADITCVVRRSPIINDATCEDARLAGLDRFARIIDPGIEALGIPFGECPAEFLAECERADIIISKGQANFETLEEFTDDERLSKKLFFLLIAKCDCVADLLGVKVGDAVLKAACK